MQSCVLQPPAIRPAALAGRQVGLRLLTALERLEYGLVPEGERSAWLVIHAAVDGLGCPICGPEDREWLSEMPAAILEPLAAAARRANRLDEESEDRLVLELLEQEELRVGLRLAMLFQAADPRTFLAGMDSPTFALWRAFLQVEPMGGQADDSRTGAVLALMANIHRDTKKRSEPFRPADWFPWLEGAPEPEDDSQGNLIEQIAKAYTLKAAATGAARTEGVDLSKVPDIYLSAADRAKRAAERQAAEARG